MSEENKEKQKEKQQEQQLEKQVVNKSRSLVSRIFHGSVDGATNAAGRVGAGFKNWLAGLGKGMGKAVTKVSVGLHVSNPVAIGILSSVVGIGGLGIFSVAMGPKYYDDVTKNDPVWVCEQDELKKVPISDYEGMEKQEVVNMIYGALHDLGYPDEFITGMVACMLVECELEPNKLESDYMPGMRDLKAQFTAVAGPGTCANSETTMHVYGPYARNFEFEGGWNGNPFYYCDLPYGEGRVTACGIGLVQWTQQRAVDFILGVDKVNGQYGCMDLQYQIAYMLAEWKTSYKTLDITGSSWNAGEWTSDEDGVLHFFVTYVSGGDPSKVGARMSRLAEAQSLVASASANSQFNTDIMDMATILADSDFAGAVARNRDARYCVNIDQMKTDSISMAALSVAWLEGAHYENDDGAHADHKMSVEAPDLINDWTYAEGLAGNDPTGTWENRHGENIKVGGHHDLIACTRYYYLAHLIVLPDETGLNNQIGYFASCDRGVCVPVRMSGSDDNYPAGSPEGQCAYMVSGMYSGKPNAFDERRQEAEVAAGKWEITGFMRGNDFYSYSGATGLSPDTVMCSWHVKYANGEPGLSHHDIAPSSLTGADADTYRFAPSMTNTGNHIITFVGQGNVRKYYSDEYLYKMYKQYPSVASSSTLCYGDINPEAPDNMKNGNTYRSQYASQGNNKKMTFYGDVESLTSPDPYYNGTAVDDSDYTVKANNVTGIDTQYNNKTGLPRFWAWGQIYKSLTEMTNTNTFSGNWGATPLDKAWKYEAATDMEYHALQFERYAMAALMCSYAVEDDINIYQQEGEDGIILGNTYRDMSYLPGQTNVVWTGDHYEYQPSASVGTHGTQFKYLFYKYVTSADMVQDLIQLYTKDAAGDYGYNERLYGLTHEDIEVLKGIQAGNLSGTIDLKFDDDLKGEDIEKALKQWIYDGGYYTMGTDGLHTGVRKDPETVYYGEYFGINPLANMTPEARDKFLTTYYFEDEYHHAEMKAYAVIDMDDNHIMKYTPFEIPGVMDTENNVGYEIVYTDGITTTHGDAVPVWDKKEQYDELLTAGGIKEYWIVDEYGRVVYKSSGEGNGWVLNPNYDTTHFTECNHPKYCHHQVACTHVKYEDQKSCSHPHYDTVCECYHLVWNGHSYERVDENHQTSNPSGANYCPHPVKKQNGYEHTADSCPNPTVTKVAVGYEHDYDLAHNPPTVATDGAAHPVSGQYEVHHNNGYDPEKYLYGEYTLPAFTCTTNSCHSDCRDDHTHKMGTTHTHCAGTKSTTFYVLARIQDNTLVTMDQALEIFKNGNSTVTDYNTDVMVQITFDYQGMIRDNYYDMAINNGHYIAYFDGGGYICCTHVDDNAAKDTDYRVADKCCHPDCLDKFEAYRYRCNGRVTEVDVIGGRYDDPVSSGGYGTAAEAETNSNSCVGVICGGDHVFHVTLTGADKDKTYWDSYAKKFTTDPKNARGDNNELVCGGDTGLWVVHASRGHRGPKCDYIVNYFGNNKQYVLYHVSTDMDYVSEYKKKIEDYNDLDTSTR